MTGFINPRYKSSTKLNDDEKQFFAAFDEALGREWEGYAHDVKEARREQAAREGVIFSPSRVYYAETYPTRAFQSIFHGFPNVLNHERLEDECRCIVREEQEVEALAGKNDDESRRRRVEILEERDKRSALTLELQRIFSGWGTLDHTVQTIVEYNAGDKAHEKARQKLWEMVDAEHPSDEARALIARAYDKYEADMIHAQKVVKREVARDKSDELFAQWIKGDFTYKKPKFESDEEIEAFVRMLKKNIALDMFLGHSIDSTVYKKADSFGSAVNDETFFDRAMATFEKKIKAHEHELRAVMEERAAHRDARERARQEAVAAAVAAKKQQEELRAQKELEDAERRRQAEAEKRAAFMSEPRPYVITGSDAVFCQAVEKIGLNPATRAEAGAFLSLITEAQGVMDIRDERVKTLGDQLYAAANLVQVARSVGLEKQVQNHNPVNALGKGEQLGFLRDIYQAGATRGAIDRLLDSNGGSMLLAARLLSEPQARSFGRTMAGYLSRLHKALDQFAAADDDTKELIDMMDSSELQREAKKDRYVKAYLDIQAIEADMAVARATIADGIRQVLSGVDPKRVEVALSGAVEHELTFPQRWKQHLGDRFEVLPSDHPKKLIIRSKQAPVEVEVANNENNIAPVVTTLEMLGTQYEANKEWVRELCDPEAGYGFMLRPENGHTLLVHPQYNIQQVLDSDQVKRSENIHQAVLAFKEAMLAQESVIGHAKGAGIRVEQQPARGTVFHFGDKQYALGQSGYFTAEDFASAQNLIDMATVPPVHAPTPMVRRQAPSAEELGSKIWEPAEPPQHIVIFDSSVLMKLETKRDGGRSSWLDLIHATAQLPNVKVVIPAVVAWEMDGHIPKHDAQGRFIGTTPVDERLERDDAHHLLQDASKARIVRVDGKDQVMIDSGKDPNIMILESPGDDQYFKVVDALRRKYRDNSAFQKEMRVQGYYGGNAGEESIERIIHQFPHACSMSVVSDDKKYLFGDAGQMPASMVSGKGMSVEHVNSLHYLESELRHWSGSKLLEGDSEPLPDGLRAAMRRFADDFANNHPDKDLPMHARFKCGDGAAIHLRDVIRQGHNDTPEHCGPGGATFNGIAESLAALSRRRQ